MRVLPADLFTVEDALARGWTHSALKNALRRGRIVRIRRGVYAQAGVSVHYAALAVADTVAHAVVSHRSAAVLHGLPLLGLPPDRVEITVPPRASTNVVDAHVYRARIRPHDLVVVQNRAVTSVPRTVIDVARHWPLRTAVVLIDAALYRELTTVEELRDVLDFCDRWPGIRRAERALCLSDGRAESPLESISRLAIGRLGLPAPEPQKWILDRSGHVLGRADFYWDDVGVVGEADGRTKYEEDEAYPKEKDRQETFEDTGLVVVRWGWEPAWRRHDVLRRKLVNGFERGRLRDRSGFPRLWTPRDSPDGHHR